MSSKYINIINFVRGVEPRNSSLDLIYPVKKQIELLKKYGYSSTFLVQYDALINDGFLSVFRTAPDNTEFGLWFEVVQQLVEKVGIKWNGREGFSWDWHVNPGFLEAYGEDEKIKIIDEAMRCFKEKFGYYPKSAGSWLIDSFSMKYMSDKYKVKAFCICREQYGTDGYTLWGGPFNQGYYPSVNNMLVPASEEENMIHTPVFRMLGTDPIYEYDSRLDSDYNIDYADTVYTMEPVWASGRDSRFIDWYYKTVFCNESIENAYIQEAFNGINILLAAYDCFGDDKYLEVAVNAAVSHMRDMRKFGFVKNGVSDYTTVTAMIIPIADAARKAEKAYPEASVYLKESAVIMADYVVKRGLDFPTETAVSNETTKEIEEGSMSCSALTVLYVYFHIRQDKRYIDYAKKVLSLHDAWTVFTQYPQCFRSTLRWWETIWEGDANGPSICCGHAWTIWRAEAEFYYSLIACDTQRFINSYNAFMSNISKADADGIMYSIFRLESIVAGKWNQKAESISKNNAFGFPVKEDNTLSRYVFARAYFTIFKTSVIAGDYVFGGRLRDGVFDTECREMKYLLIDGFIGRLTVNTFTGLKIFTKQEYYVLSGNLKNSEILPKNGNIVIELKKSAQNAEGRL